MQRFRITILAVCLILAWLGYNDLRILLRNPKPLTISINQLEETGAPREWLTVTDGYQDLLQGINMSGSMNVDAFLIPLKAETKTQTLKVWIETRDVNIIEALKTYYFTLENDQQRLDYLNRHAQLFLGQRRVTGMFCLSWNWRIAPVELAS